MILTTPNRKIDVGESRVDGPYAITRNQRSRLAGTAKACQWYVTITDEITGDLGHWVITDQSAYEVRRAKRVPRRTPGEMR